MGVSEVLAPQPLVADDDLSSFDCGSAPINEWLVKRAERAQRAKTASVYVSKDAEGKVAGFYMLSAHCVERAQVSGGWLKRNVPDRIPVFLLGMLGVDVRFQGAGLGRSLLSDAILRARVASKAVAARALVVDPVGEGVVSFYEHYGFRMLPGTDRLYLPLA